MVLKFRFFFLDVRVTPLSQGKVHPFFVRDCSRAVQLCKNIKSFTYTPETFPALIPMLRGKTQLETLRSYAGLTTDQAQMLLELKGIQKLTLDYGSWNVMDILPTWIGSIQKNLTSLTLYVSFLSNILCPY